MKDYLLNWLEEYEEIENAEEYLKSVGKWKAFEIYAEWADVFRYRWNGNDGFTDYFFDFLEDQKYWTANTKKSTIEYYENEIANETDDETLEITKKEYAQDMRFLERLENVL